MKENDEETLQKMFPEGYVIVYTMKDKTIWLQHFNPKKYPDLEEFRDLLEKEAGK